MASMRSVWCGGGLSLVLGSSMGLVACGGGLANSQPTASSGGAAADDETTADLTEHHRHHHHGGVTMFIAMSLDSLGISPEQRTVVEKVQADLFAKMAPARLAERGVVLAIAEGIAAGAVDRGKVDSAIDQVATAAGALHESTADALNQLHAVLTPPQRAALVDKVQAHWDVWKRANAEDERAGQDPGGGHLSQLARVLGLTPNQVDRVRASVGAAMSAGPARFDTREVDSHLQTFGPAFEAEPFDAKALSLEGSANARLAGWGAAHMARFYEAVDPILSPEQRARLAQMLRDHADHKEES
jgi:Spy/CpxP family protein refolding chaperone